jgi:Transcriptional Coactivator p15 (PC4)
MWKNPKYASEAEPAPSTPPAERGQRLATIPRGRTEELRIALDEFEGRPYVALRLWAQGSDGGFWPVRGKGLSVRVKELDDVIAALGQARDLLDA